jgi:hypothetical protein
MESFNTAYTVGPGYESGGWQRYRPQIKTEKEANYAQTRPKGSRARSININLVWPRITAAEGATGIQTFFDANQGTVFNWTDFFGNTLNVMFADDSISIQPVEPYGYFKVSVTLEEQ